MPKSLQEFAVGEKSTTCTVCNAPDEVRAQIEANERAPQRISRALVVKWALSEFDHKTSVDTIYRHMRDHV